MLAQPFLNVQSNSQCWIQCWASVFGFNVTNFCSQFPLACTYVDLTSLRTSQKLLQWLYNTHGVFGAGLRSVCWAAPVVGLSDMERHSVLAMLGLGVWIFTLTSARSSGTSTNLPQTQLIYNTHYMLGCIVCLVLIQCLAEFGVWYPAVLGFNFTNFCSQFRLTRTHVLGSLRIGIMCGVAFGVGLRSGFVIFRVGLYSVFGVWLQP